MSAPPESASRWRSLLPLCWHWCCRCWVAARTGGPPGSHCRPGGRVQHPAGLAHAPCTPPTCLSAQAHTHGHRNRCIQSRGSATRVYLSCTLILDGPDVRIYRRHVIPHTLFVRKCCENESTARTRHQTNETQHCLSGPVCCAVRFEFDAIHNPSASQEEVFAAVRPLCESALDGYNITVLAYGQVPFPCCVGVLWWYGLVFRPCIGHIHCPVPFAPPSSHDLINPLAMDRHRLASAEGAIRSP